MLYLRVAEVPDCALGPKLPEVEVQTAEGIPGKRAGAVMGSWWWEGVGGSPETDHGVEFTGKHGEVILCLRDL